MSTSVSVSVSCKTCIEAAEWERRHVGPAVGGGLVVGHETRRGRHLSRPAHCVQRAATSHQSAERSRRRHRTHLKKIYELRITNYEERVAPSALLMGKTSVAGGMKVWRWNASAPAATRLWWASSGTARKRTRCSDRSRRRRRTGGRRVLPPALDWSQCPAERSRATGSCGNRSTLNRWPYTCFS